MSERVRQVVVFVVVTALSIGLDQLTKVVASQTLRGQPMTSYLGDTFRLQFATNEGAFLSLGASLPDWARFWLLTVSVGVLLIGLCVYAVVSPLPMQAVVGYGLVASGGLSNWVDRVRFDGRVVDFMNVGLGPVRSGIFNIADLAILAGIALLVLLKPPPVDKAPAPEGAAR